MCSKLKVFRIDADRLVGRTGADNALDDTDRVGLGGFLHELPVPVLHACYARMLSSDRSYINRQHVRRSTLERSCLETFVNINGA